MKRLPLFLIFIALPFSASAIYDVNSFIISPWYIADALPNIDNLQTVWSDYIDSSQTQTAIKVYDFRTNALLMLPTNDPYSTTSPKISGRYVVYGDTDPIDYMYHFYCYDLQTHSKTDISADYMAMGSIPNIDAPHITYFNCSDANCNEYNAYVYDLQSHTQAVISPYYSGYSGYPNIDGRYVAWRDCTDSNCLEYGIFCYDLDSNELSKIAPSSDLYLEFLPAVDGNYVAWWDCIDQNDVNPYIRVYDFSTDQIKNICRYYRQYGMVTLAGNYVIWADEDPNLGISYLYAYDLEKGIKIPVSPLYDNYLDYPPSCDGRYIVWTDDKYPEATYYIFGYDLQTYTKFEIARLNQMLSNVNIDNGIVVWHDYNDLLGYGYVYAARIFNDSCPDAIEIVDNEIVHGDNYASTGDMSSGCAFNDTTDVWYYYKALSGGDVTVTVDGINFDTTLAAYNACGGTMLACNDDYDIYDTDSRIDFIAVKGKTYYIRVAGFNQQLGSFELQVTRGTCTGLLKGDMNNDCQVDFTDFAEFCADWMQCNLDPPSLCWQ